MSAKKKAESRKQISEAGSEAYPSCRFKLNLTLHHLYSYNAYERSNDTRLLRTNAFVEWNSRNHVLS